jgi:hypothetical protein
LQWITHTSPPDAYRFDHPPGEPARGLSTVSFRLREFPHGLELQTGTAAFSRGDAFSGILTPPFTGLGSHIPATLDTNYLNPDQFPRVPLQNWAVPEDHFEPLSQQVLALRLNFQLNQPYTDSHTGQTHPAGTLLHDPPHIERPPGSGFTQVDLPKIGAIHISLAITNQTLLRRLDPALIQQYARHLHTLAQTTPTNQLTTQTWQTALTKNTPPPPPEIPKTLPTQTRVYHHVLFVAGE